MSMRDEFEKHNAVPVGAVWNSRKRGYYYSSSPSVAHSFNDLWESFCDGWQAARAQGAEPVAWLIYDEDGNPLSPTTSEEIAELSAARSGRDSVPLYTQPQSAGVPETATEEMLDEGVTALIRGFRAFPGNYTQVVSNIWEDMRAAATAPQDDGWVKCSEQLPTEADDDYQGCVWAHFEDGDIELMEAEEVEQTWDDDISITHWKPTGLKRPQPPKEQ